MSVYLDASVLHEIIVAIDGIQMAVAGKAFADFQKDWLPAMELGGR